MGYSIERRTAFLVDMCEKYREVYDAIADGRIKGGWGPEGRVITDYGPFDETVVLLALIHVMDDGKGKCDSCASAYRRACWNSLFPTPQKPKNGSAK